MGWRKTHEVRSQLDFESLLSAYHICFLGWVTLAVWIFISFSIKWVHQYLPIRVTLKITKIMMWDSVQHVVGGQSIEVFHYLSPSLFPTYLYTRGSCHSGVLPTHGSGSLHMLLCHLEVTISTCYPSFKSFWALILPCFPKNPRKGKRSEARFSHRHGLQWLSVQLLKWG